MCTYAGFSPWQAGRVKPKPETPQCLSSLRTVNAQYIRATSTIYSICNYLISFINFTLLNNFIGWLNITKL